MAVKEPTRKQMQRQKEQLAKRSIHDSINMDRVYYALHHRSMDGQQWGFCFSCGSDEPVDDPEIKDAPCTSCDASKVYGATSALEYV
tara:strand:- start:629 stop:889 length:261 start_codon:yes stop_codon:yes gene_type:complete